MVDAGVSEATGRSRGNSAAAARQGEASEMQRLARYLNLLMLPPRVSNPDADQWRIAEKQPRWFDPGICRQEFERRSRSAIMQGPK
jgi:hypothetical protein